MERHACDLADVVAVVHAHRIRARHTVAQRAEKLHGHKIAFLHEQDLGRSHYWNELFPTDDDWQVIQDLRVQELMVRLGQIKGVKEIVIATNPNLEGEATSMYLERLIKPMGIRLTRLARGLPVGGDLEYADEVTLTRALEGRREI